jgi:hypothetical protein
MDPASLVTGLMAAQIGQAQLIVAAKLLKISSDNAAGVAKLMAAAQQNFDSLANIAAGIGGNLNVSA